MINLEQHTYSELLLMALSIDPEIEMMPRVFLEEYLNEAIAESIHIDTSGFGFFSTVTNIVEIPLNGAKIPPFSVTGEVVDFFPLSKKIRVRLNFHSKYNPFNTVTICDLKDYWQREKTQYELDMEENSNEDNKGIEERGMEGSSIAFSEGMGQDYPEE